MFLFRPRRGSEPASSETSSFVGKSRVLMLGSLWTSYVSETRLTPNIRFIVIVRVSMSLEKIFRDESQTFLFGFRVLFAVLIGVSGSVYFRFVVRLCMVFGAFQCWLA